MSDRQLGWLALICFGAGLGAGFGLGYTIRSGRDLLDLYREVTEQREQQQWDS